MCPWQRDARTAWGVLTPSNHGTPRQRTRSLVTSLRVTKGAILGMQSLVTCLHSIDSPSVKEGCSPPGSSVSWIFQASFLCVLFWWTPLGKRWTWSRMQLEAWVHSPRAAHGSVMSCWPTEFWNKAGLPGRLRLGQRPYEARGFLLDSEQCPLMG